MPKLFFDAVDPRFVADNCPSIDFRDGQIANRSLLDSWNRVIEVEELFRGTFTQTDVYPRSVVRRELHHNAGVVKRLPVPQTPALTRTKIAA